MSPLSHTLSSHNSSALPEKTEVSFINSAFEETFLWEGSGKLAEYSSSTLQKKFSYTDEGKLSKEELLELLAPDTKYNLSGEVISQNAKAFTWDPWGKLLQVKDEKTVWKASYDALGRRLKVHFNPEEGPEVEIISLYDPAKEFEEIGIRSGGKVFWKVYGPSSCDAITDETGSSVFLTYNALQQLVAACQNEETLYAKAYPSLYGPKESTLILDDLVSYAFSHSWQGLAPDTTGLILMGVRYYDPKTEKFLSQDPVGYPLCTDLYSYANSDPVNFRDPDGRFASAVYRTGQALVANGILPFPAHYGIKVVANALYPDISAYNENNLAIYEKGVFDSKLFTVGSVYLANGATMFVNGINNTFEESREGALQVSNYAKGSMVFGVYNATNGVLADVKECRASQLGGQGIPAHLLKKNWAHLISIYGPSAKFLVICHSGGAGHVKNALESSPEFVRQRIIVLAIAPSVIIPDELCFKSYNYMSRRDFVTRLDRRGLSQYPDQLTILEPHPDADLHDHAFLSPTFKRKIKGHVDKYIEEYGGG